MSSFILRIAASPSRTTRWSSAISTLIFSMDPRLLFIQGDVDDDGRAMPFFGLDLAFTAYEPSPLKDSPNSEVIPFIGVAQHGVHVESHAVVHDGDAEKLGVDVQPHGDPGRFRMFLHITEGFLHNAKQKDLRTWEQELFIAGYAKLGLDMILRLVRGQVVSQGREQLHLVIVERAEIEDSLPRFMNGQLQLSFTFAQGGQAGLRI